MPCWRCAKKPDMPRILLIEDEIKTLEALQEGLRESFASRVDAAADGLAGLELALANTYDLIISDITMPRMSGLAVCRELRNRHYSTPILLLTALGDTDHIVEGLDAGADDYLSKPFEFKELMARAKALLRRAAPPAQASLLRFADLELNTEAKSVQRGGQAISLTPREFAFLELLLQTPGRVFSKAEIAEKVWEIDFDTGTNVVEVYVNYLRNKIDKGFDKKLIHTQFGQGYVLREI